MRKVLFQIEDAFSELNVFRDIIAFLLYNHDKIVEKVQDATRDEWKCLDLKGITNLIPLNPVIYYKAGEHYPYDGHDEVIFVSYEEGGCA